MELERIRLPHPQDFGYIPNNPEVYHIDPPVVPTRSSTWSSAYEPNGNNVLPDNNDSDIFNQDSSPELPSDPWQSSHPRQRRSST